MLVVVRDASVARFCSCSWCGAEGETDERVVNLGAGGVAGFTTRAGAGAGAEAGVGAGAGVGEDPLCFFKSSACRAKILTARWGAGAGAGVGISAGLTGTDSTFELSEGADAGLLSTITFLISASTSLLLNGTSRNKTRITPFPELNPQSLKLVDRRLAIVACSLLIIIQTGMR